MVRDESGIWTLIGIVSTGSFIIHLYFYIIILKCDVSINKKVLCQQVIDVSIVCTILWRPFDTKVKVVV